MKLNDEVRDWDALRWQRKVFLLFLDSEMEPLAKGKATIRCNEQNRYVEVGEFRFNPRNIIIMSPSRYFGCRVRAQQYESFLPLERDELDRRLREKEASRLIEKHPGEAADLLGVPRGAPVLMLVRSYRIASSGDQEAFFELMKEHHDTAAKQALRSAIRRVRMHFEMRCAAIKHESVVRE